MRNGRSVRSTCAGPLVSRKIPPWLKRCCAERQSAAMPVQRFSSASHKLSGAEGIPANKTEGALWIQRAAARGLKEAQELLRGTRDKPAKK